MKITTSKNKLKIVISKKEWLKIADENSLTIQDMVFKVGEMYKNRKGNYRVIGIDVPQNLIKVKYVGGEFDGEEQTLDAFGQYKVIRNTALEEDRRLGINSINFNNDKGNYFTIGFLASHGTITIQTTDEKELETRKIYQGLTGQVLQDNQLEVVPHINPTTGAFNKYTHEFRIYFKPPSSLLTLPSDIDIRDINKNLHSINNNNYIWNLLKIGFLVGNNSGNIDRIRSFIPKEFLDDFDAGVASA